VAPTLIVDTFSIFYRSFFALPPLSTTRGEPTSALFGFCSVLLKVWREHRPAAASFARDLPIPTFRHAAWSGYKANRGAPPDALRAQLGHLDELLDAFGFPVVAVPGFEADDVMATLARSLPEPLLVTGDHDCLQVAEGQARVLIVGRGRVKDRLYDAEEVRRAFGVPPDRVPDWIALVGDPSDNLPGVPGVGDKTATRLLQAFGDVDGVLGHLTEVTPARVRESLAAHGAELRTWRDLARLRDDVPLPPGPHAGPFTEAARARLGELFEEWELRSLLARLADM
jgi:DNA polymerase-1